MHPTGGRPEGDDEEDQPHYEWDEQEYKANFVRFFNEEPIIDTTIRIAAGTVNKTVEPCCYSRSECIYAVPAMTGPALKGRG